MITVKFRYSDGVVVIKQFKTMAEMHKYAHNEGDHLIEIIYL